MAITLPSRRLVSQEDASTLQRRDIPRSKFIGAWTHKTTFDAGQLIPFLVDELLPGDHMKYDVSAFVRMATPVFPLMDSQRIDTHFFFVPIRILWANFVKFMGEQDSPTDHINYQIPSVGSPVGGFAEYSLFDYFGLPTDLDPAGLISVNVLPLRAYKLIYHEWFRDQNLSAGTKPRTTDTGDTWSEFEIYYRAKSHDYFTSALPWPQKFTAPTVALGGQAPVKGIAVDDGHTPNAGNPAGHTETGGSFATGWSGYYNTSATSAKIRAISALTGADPVIYADLSGATGVSINTLREAFLVQQLLEQDARGGTRFPEIIKRHFDVQVPDYRLMRPELIGVGSSRLDVTPIAQTAPTAGVPVGTLGAAGTAVGSHTASFAATEPGYVIGIVSVKSELSYSQGLHRMWMRRTRYDLPWPELAGLGEQAVLQQEIYCKGIAADTTVFGYQERYQEFRTRTSYTTAKFRSSAAGTLDGWHLGENYAAAPVLGVDFIEDTPPMERVLAAGTSALNQQYLADFHIQRQAVRALPLYGTPVTLGRF